MDGLIIILFIVFFGILVGVFWDLFGNDKKYRDEIEQDLDGWWEYFIQEDEDDDDENEDKTVNGNR